MKDRIRIAALVMAAGRSTRMGLQNKLLLQFRDKPLVNHVVANLIQSGVDEVIVVIGHQAELVGEALTDLGIQTVHNPDYANGIATSIRAGLAAIGVDVSGFMVCLADQPLILPGEYQMLREAFVTAAASDPDAIVVPYFNQRRGNPVILSTTYRSAVDDLAPDEGFRRIIEANSERVKTVEMPNDHILVDVDTLDMYRSISIRKP